MPNQNHNPGNFANNPQRAAEAGRKGGQASSGNFANNPSRAAEAGRKGGQNSHANRTQEENQTATRYDATRTNSRNGDVGAGLNAPSRTRDEY